MKNHHELPHIYTNFATMIKTRFSNIIKVFHCDNAMEYCDSKLLTFLAEQGTLSEFSCPGTSQQNGCAWRKHRHILDSVRAMLVSSSCPERAWGEATLTAVYTINHLLSCLLGNVSPFVHLYHTPLDYSSLKVFGCAYFVLLQAHEYTKPKPHPRLCYFLGYGIEHKGYHCWAPISQRVHVSHHVIFWEHHMFSSLFSFKSISSTSSPFFTNSSIDLFPSDIDAGSSRELIAPYDVSTAFDDPVLDVDPTSIALPPPDRPTKVRNPPSSLCDYRCFSTILHLHEPQCCKEASTDPHW